MSKISVTLIAALILVLAFVVLPASAEIAKVGTHVDRGATVFIGESSLDVQDALVDQFGNNYNCIGYWASGASILGSSPLKTLNLENRMTLFEVADSDFVGYTGNWYQYNATAHIVGDLAFTVVDPTLDIQVWDPVNGQSVNGRTIVQGHPLTFQILTNQYQVVNGRKNVNTTTPVKQSVAGFSESVTGYAASYTTQISSQTVSFNGASKSSHPSWQWSFENHDSTATEAPSITSSSIQSPLVTFEYNAASGSTYDITLTVTDSTDAAQKSVVSGTVDISSTGVVTIDTPTVTTNYFVTLTDSSTYAGIDSTLFNWGNAASSSIAVTTNGSKIQLKYVVTGSLTDTITHTVENTKFNDAYNSYYGKSGNYTSTATKLITITAGTPTNNPDVSDTGTTITSDPVLSSSVPQHEGVVILSDIAGGYNENLGYITIKVKSSSGSTYSSLVNNTSASNPLTNQYVNTQPYFWGGIKTSSEANNSVYLWDTSATSGGVYMYPQGSYSVWAESYLNGMKDNYRSAGADYTGKTVSQTYTVSFQSNTVKLEANKDTVTRGKTFSVTLTGDINTPYAIWLKDTSSLDANTTLTDKMPPRIALNQEGVDVGNTGVGTYKPSNSDKTIGENTPNWTGTGSPYYAEITTNSAGTRTIEFTTESATKAQKYEIRAESRADPTKHDEIEVTVEKGAVTIVAKGDQTYYLGEEIKFSGVNSESYTTYLFIIGPNLKTTGSDLSDPDPRNKAVITDNPDSFAKANVNGDNTWSYNWGTSSIALDAGTYTIFAESSPKNSDGLANTTYGTVSIVINKPFVSATMSQTVVAQGDAVHIVGTAEGDPNSLNIWVFGKNYFERKTQTVRSDASYDYEIQQGTTKTLSSGQYFVVVQHPMQNDQFDIELGGNNNEFVINRQLMTGGSTTPLQIFKISGSSSLQGSDAAEALVEALNSAYVDDTYTKLQFMVQTPQIVIDQISDKHIGDKFTITGVTNLAVGDNIQIEVYSSSFKPTLKTQSGAFNGATGTVVVQKGIDSNGFNTFKFDVDASSFKSDEYLVKADGIIQDATGTALFNVLDSTGISVAPTQVTSNVTPAITAVPPTPVLTAATPTPIPPATTTKSSPGFGALIALVGLGAVAFVVARRG
jgi:PGF-CTERM protein